MIKRELIEVVLTSNVKDYYISKGYELPTKIRTKIQVWSTDLPEKSGATIVRICDCCGYSRKVALKAHHLYAYEAHKDLALDIENGVALCSNCHEEFHKQYGWGENTPEQYVKFKEAYNG